MFIETYTCFQLVDHAFDGGSKDTYSKGSASIFIRHYIKIRRYCCICFGICMSVYNMESYFSEYTKKIIHKAEAKVCQFDVFRRRPDPKGKYPYTRLLSYNKRSSLLIDVSTKWSKTSFTSAILSFTGYLFPHWPNWSYILMALEHLLHQYSWLSI